MPADDLRLFTLEDDGRRRRITTTGVAWRSRHYVAAWMTGHVGTIVRLRWMPHHAHQAEAFDADAGEHLGPAMLADQASPEQIRAIGRARGARKARLEADLRAVEKTRRQRYAAQTTSGPVGAVNAAEADAELADSGDEELVRAARPRLLPPRAAGAGLGAAPAGEQEQLLTGWLDISDRDDHYLGLRGRTSWRPRRC